MALEVYPKEQAFRNAPVAKTLLDYLLSTQEDLRLESAFVFCNFPLFREEGVVLTAPLILVSPLHGVFLFAFPEDARAFGETPSDTAKSLEGTYSQVFSKLVRYPRLRKNRNTLAATLEAYLFSPEEPVDYEGDSDLLLVGLGSVKRTLDAQRLPKPLADEIIAEIISVLDGSKALIRPPDRDIKPFSQTSKVARIVALEEEIRRFDRDQRIAYMSEISGPQRIRGLAGSGKTVVLAIKAALTHVREPDARIAFTFYTKALYQHVKQLITRFYRLYDDRDPDWTKLRILHAWGGDVVEGLYSFAAKAHGEVPLTFAQARAFDPHQPFDYVCNRLISNSSLNSLFDYIFVDEAQDFTPSFLRLALRLADEEKLVIAYDVLQTIFDVEMPTVEVLFGTDKRGEPAVHFEEDIVLHKCYRNPREILVCAHALGFGIYGPRIVQMLESKEHWEDFGYQVTKGEFISGQEIVIERPEENSPSSISKDNSINQLIEVQVFSEFSEEIDYVVGQIVKDISEEGVSPEDILVICADDKNIRSYFRNIATELNRHGIACNNLQQDSFGLTDFRAAKKVTLSTVYKAKGNEAFIVFLVGIDALFDRKAAKRRNMVFTAMTRAKGWLRVSGLGTVAERFAKELDKAKEHFPKLQFVYPSSEQLVIMKRDLVTAESGELENVIDRLTEEFSDEDLEDVLSRKLQELRKRKRTHRKTHRTQH
jgi:superfamily I DNA and RNA helicase